MNLVLVVLILLILFGGGGGYYYGGPAVGGGIGGVLLVGLIILLLLGRRVEAPLRGRKGSGRWASSSSLADRSLFARPAIPATSEPCSNCPKRSLFRCRTRN